MNKKVIIIGAGGHGRVVADIVRLNGDEVIGFIDDNKTGFVNGCEVLGTIKDIGKFDCYYFAAIGDNATRQKIMEKDVKWYTAIHPSAVVAKDVEIPCGVVIMANAVVNPGSVIGEGVIINTAATVDHDNVIGDFVHLSPGVHLAGTVTIKERTWVGIGAIVINNVTICSDAMIGAGTVVAKDITECGTYVGVPARIRI